MKSKLVFVALIMMLASCTQIKELTTMLNCDYRLSTVDNIKLADIDVQKIKSYSDLSLKDGMKLLAAVTSGTLPLNMTVNVEVRNPNAQSAALNKLDWILLIDDVEVANGSTTKRIEISPNNGIGTLPIQIGTDLVKILSGQSAQNMINFGLNLAGYGNKPTRFTLKAKPTILIGSTAIVYPGYINISSEFGTN
ncbi:MAG: hypothetical protein WCQ95_05960 [Bacteroidota bacterium]